MKPLFTEQGNVFFEQSRLSLECKKLYADAIDPENFFDKKLIDKWYGGAHGGFHKMYVVEIERVDALILVFYSFEKDAVDITFQPHPSQKK